MSDKFEEFERDVREALAHLYDPTYHPPESIWRATDCNPAQGVDCVRATLIQAIEGLKPAADVPSSARIRRIYELLFYRYVQNLTQEEAAERLCITPRHLRREQQQAVHILAQRLWERSHVGASSAADHASEIEVYSPEAEQDEAMEWRSQIRREIASLQKSAPDAVADVGDTIRGVTSLARALTSKHGVGLKEGLVPPNLIAIIHPSALRQILVTAIAELVRHMTSGQITLRAERAGECVRIAIVGSPVTISTPPNDYLIRELLAVQGGSLEFHLEAGSASFCVSLPSAGKITVLVVDDNADLVHFYERYTAGTRYQIVHVPEGQRVFEIVETSAPDIIVLDIMLSDIDGWELLANLREHPVTRSIPVIVCSVVREEELAMALGAALYVPKPVRRQQFIQALDRALSQAATRAPESHANNARSY